MPRAMRLGAMACDAERSADHANQWLTRMWVGLVRLLQHLVWLLLSAILWLGNVGFEKATDDTVSVRRDEALANAAALLGVAEGDLAQALSERTLSAGEGECRSAGGSAHALGLFSQAM